MEPPDMTLKRTIYKLPLIAFTLLLIAQPSLSATKVYKKVMPDGSISYSDEAQDDAEVLNVEPVPTVPAFKAPPSESKPEVKTEEKPKNFYASLTILSPENDTAFNSGSGTVEVKFKNNPSLIRGHKYKIFLGSLLLSEQTENSFVTSNVDRGTHQLSVHIVDQAGRVLKSATNTFTLHRPVIRKQPRQ